MGVTGLWDLIRPAAARTSLSALSRDAYYANKNGLRALTVGIDASIWIFHAQVPQHGENPFLRTIFFKITALLQHPLLPVFVFDGPKKPALKRNQSVAGGFGTADHRSKQFKALLDVCGLEWWNAPGEAEAELAVMNRQGKIDAVLSDDVDALVFGATCVLRNPSATLSGAQASTITQGNSGRSDSRHYEMYRSSTIRELWVAQEGTELKTEEDCRLAMVLVALLSGGDYTPEGTFGIGPRLSYGLAHAGMAEFLKAYATDKSFNKRLQEVHALIVDELRTNSSKQLSRREGVKAKQMEALPATRVFPATTLEAYLNPCTSPLNNASQGWPGFGKGQYSQIRGKARNDGRGDMEGLAKACERYFEWGTRELVSKKFAGESVGVFAAEVMNSAREAVRERARASDSNASVLPEHRSVGMAGVGSSSLITSFFLQSASSSLRSKPGSPLPSSLQQTSADKTPAHILRINSTRPDPTNSDILEYRVSYLHETYTQRCHVAMNGHRPEPSELSSMERERLGLVGSVERDADEDVPPATQAAGPVPKTEARVWLPEYLVREAWPELLRDWEEKVAAKEAAKLKAKKKAAAPKPVVATVVRATGVGGAGKGKGKKILAADGEDVGAFSSFFTQKAKPPAAPREESHDAKRTPHQAKAKADVIDLTVSPSPSPKAGRSRRRSPSVRTKKTVEVIAVSPSPPPAVPYRTRSRSVRTPRQAKGRVEVIDLSLSPSPSPQAGSPRTRTRSALTSSVSSTPSDGGVKSGKRRTGKSLGTTSKDALLEV